MWKPLERHALERPPTPAIAPRPARGRTVVIAPHPDDETFGMGGTLRLHVEQGDRVDVVFLTDGGFGDPEGHYRDRDYGAVRRAEAAAACAVLGVGEPVFYGYPDHYPTVSDEALDDLAARLAAELRGRGAANVYFPWPGECHADHWAAARAATRAVAGLPGGVRTFGYEVWSALVPDFVIEVTATRPAKLEAGRCYESQLRYTPYLPITDGLMTYRSLFLELDADDPPRYAEAFVEIERP